MYNTISLELSKHKTIFYVKNESVESANQYDFIMSYMEKSSLGDGNCLIKEVYNGDKDRAEYIVYKLVGWTASRRKLSVHDNYEDAKQAELDAAYYDYVDAHNYAIMYDSYEDAYESLIRDYADCNDIDIDVSASIIRKKEIVRKLRAERSQASELRRSDEKNKLEAAVIEEAATIIVDAEFSASLIEAESKSNTEKVKLQVIAMKRLLVKNNKQKIDSDFWKVFRILKRQVRN